jgi:hypothetical protein
MTQRFTLPYAVLVAAWLAQAGFALGLVAAAAPLAPEAWVPVLIPIPAIAPAVATEPALWR